MTNTPFIDFWKAINDQLAADGYPDLRFGPARRLYGATIEEARRDAIANAFAYSKAAN